MEDAQIALRNRLTPNEILFLRDRVYDWASVFNDAPRPKCTLAAYLTLRRLAIEKKYECVEPVFKVSIIKPPVLSEKARQDLDAFLNSLSQDDKDLMMCDPFITKITQTQGNRRNDIRARRAEFSAKLKTEEATNDKARSVYDSARAHFLAIQRQHAEAKRFYDEQKHNLYLALAENSRIIQDGLLRSCGVDQNVSPRDR